MTFVISSFDLLTLMHCNIITEPKKEESCASKPVAKVEPNEPAGNEYKAPEYYAHDINTYGQLFVDMEKYRLPQPSAKR